MYPKGNSLWKFALAVLAFSLIACGAQSLLPSSQPDFPSVPPTPAAHGKQTGSSAMSGDWNASPEFGRFAFTVDPDGKNITTAVFELHNYVCGGTTLSIQEQTIELWPIAEGRFAGRVDFNPGHIEDLTVSGTFDKVAQKFSGTWEEDAYGTHCKGAWETAARE